MIQLRSVSHCLEKKRRKEDSPWPKPLLVLRKCCRSAGSKKKRKKKIRLEKMTITLHRNLFLFICVFVCVCFMGVNISIGEEISLVIYVNLSI